MRTYSFNTAFTQARELYGVAVNPDEFETIGLIAWDRIGNKQVKYYRYDTTPLYDESGKGYYIELPCNWEYIEAVVADYEDYQKTSNKAMSADIPNGWIEGYVESRKYNTNFLYISGKYIKHEIIENTMYLSDRFQTVTIVYAGILADDDGLPYLNVKEIDAIAVFVAYTHYYKSSLMTRDTNLMQFAKDLEAKWKNLCTQARVPIYINQNEMDEILNVASSWDRKRFGKSYKPMK